MTYNVFGGTLNLALSIYLLSRFSNSLKIIALSFIHSFNTVFA